MTVQIKLKQKYRIGGKGKYKGGESPDKRGLRKRKKLSDTMKMALPLQKKRTLKVDGRTGKSVMVDAG